MPMIEIGEESAGKPIKYRIFQRFFAEALDRPRRQGVDDVEKEKNFSALLAKCFPNGRV